MPKKLIGNPIIQVDECISTNVLMVELDNMNTLPMGTVVSANFQTLGKGQFTKIWQSDKSQNILMSILFRTENMKIENIFLLNKAFCIALQEAIQFFLLEYKVYIKWPNDIIVNHKKICGVLIENTIQNHRVSRSILGIGINVNQMVFEDLRLATSFKQLTNTTFALEDIQNKIFERLEFYYKLLMNQNHTFIDERYHELLYKNSINNRFILNNETKYSKVMSVNDDGMLVLILDDVPRTFQIGDIKQILGPE